MHSLSLGTPPRRLSVILLHMHIYACLDVSAYPYAYVYLHVMCACRYTYNADGGEFTMLIHAAGRQRHAVR